jgi:hypothetical protein
MGVLLLDFPHTRLISVIGHYKTKSVKELFRINEGKYSEKERAASKAKP